MKPNSTLPRWAQACLGFFLLVIALCSGGLSLYINAAYGLHRSFAWAAIFILTDTAKISLPIVARCLGGWDAFMRMLFAGCLGFSIWAALSFYQETDTATIRSAETAQSLQNGAAAELTKIEAELSGIEEDGTVSALVSLAQAEKEFAAREEQSGRGPRWQTHLTQYAAYTARISAAKRRDKLEARRNSLRASLKSEKPKAVGATAAIASMLDIKEADVARRESLIRTLVTIALMEGIAFLSGYAAALLAPLFRPRPAVKVRKTVSTPAIEAHGSNELAARRRLQLLLINSRSGEISRTQRELADQLGIAKSTLNGWLKKWKHQGLISTSTKSGKTCIKLTRLRETA